MRDGITMFDNSLSLAFLSSYEPVNSRDREQWFVEVAVFRCEWTGLCSGPGLLSEKGVSSVNAGLFIHKSKVVNYSDWSQMVTLNHSVCLLVCLFFVFIFLFLFDEWMDGFWVGRCVDESMDRSID